jgi:hypothetical protein
MNDLYKYTLVPDSPWSRIAVSTRRHLLMTLWVVTWGALVLGYVDIVFWKLAIAITAAQALVVLSLVGFNPLVFPAQLRIAYVGWLVLGTFVPELRSMMYITTVGLGAMLACGYCPLARMLYLLPWNRRHPLSWRVALQTMIQPPVAGRFEVKLEAGPAHGSRLAASQA